VQRAVGLAEYLLRPIRIVDRVAPAQKGGKQHQRHQKGHQRAHRRHPLDQVARHEQANTSRYGGNEDQPTENVVHEISPRQGGSSDNRKSKIKNPKSKIENRKSKIKSPKPKMQDRQSRIQDPRSKIKNPRSEIENPKSRTEDQNPLLDAFGLRSSAWASLLAVRHRFQRPRSAFRFAGGLVSSARILPLKYLIIPPSCRLIPATLSLSRSRRAASRYPTSPAT
jgi:hypothetical protein